MKRAKRNSSLCAYRNCKNDFRNKNIVFFKFPIQEQERCKLWLEASERKDLLENWKEAEDFRLCQDHFENSMFFNNNLKNRLNQTAIPTIFESKIKTEIKIKWADIMKFHNYSHPAKTTPNSNNNTVKSRQFEQLHTEMQAVRKIDISKREHIDDDDEEEQILPDDETEMSLLPSPAKKLKPSIPTKMVRTSSQNVQSSSKIKIHKLQIMTEFSPIYLGLKRNRLFLVESLAKTFDIKHRDVYLTLRKIKMNEQNQRIGNAFGLSENEVECLFKTTVPKIAECLRGFILWPDDATMKSNVPINLRQHFSKIHLILNYLVVKLKTNWKQSTGASSTNSTYCPVDQCHKLKFLIASTLDGCVCFVSRGFGISTDDEQLLLKSGFLKNFKTNTNLIAGKNFYNFEDRLANGSEANNGHSLDDESLEDNFGEIVSEKISKSRHFKLKNYIENILENFENFQIFNQNSLVDHKTFELLDDIVAIVAALINLQKQEID